MNAQTTVPGLANRQIDWAMRTPSGPIVAPLPGFIGQDVGTNQLQSSEDWWYDTKPIYESGVHTGYIVCGFARYKNMKFTEQSLTPPGLIKNPTDDAGTPYNDVLTNLGDCNQGTIQNEWISEYRGTISRYDLNGKLVWCKPQQFGGGLNGILQTNDGGFIAIGETSASFKYNLSPLIYNPTSISDTPLINRLANTQIPKERFHCYVIKVDINGNELWSYIYGDQSLTNDNAQNDLVYNSSENVGLDIEKNTFTGGYTFVSSTNTTAILINIDQNGLIANPTADIRTLTNPQGYNANNLSCNNGECIVNLNERLDPNGSFYAGRDGHLLRINQSNLLNSTAWSTNPLVFSSGDDRKCQFYDNILENDGSVVLTNVLLDFGGYGSGTNRGEGRIIKLNPLGQISSLVSIGNVRAYDLKIGITKTNDNGYAIVSSKIGKDANGNPQFASSTAPPFAAPFLDFQNQAGVTCNDEFLPIRNTDAYVAKFANNLSLLWEKQFDSDDLPPSNYPGNWKKQECLYRIAEGADGSLVIAGNTSDNLDDYYFAKIYSDCQNKFTYDTKDISDNIIDINSNITWSSPRKVIGKVVVKNGVTLTISNTTIEFADSRRVGVNTRIVIEKGGRLIVNNSSLTSLQACEQAVWDGIEVQGSPTLRQNPISNQGYVELNNSTVSNALNAVSTSAFMADNKTTDWSKTGGGIVKSTNTQFINNRRSFEFMAYQAIATNGALLNDASSIRLSTFKTTPTFGNGGNLTDPVPHITMWRTRNVTLQGNTFQNLRPFVATDKKGIAISAVDAAFTIDQTCSGIATPSNPCPGPNVKTNFTDLYIGVVVSNGVSNASFGVKNCIFNNNLYGVRVGGSDYGIITNNTFNIPNAKIANLTKYAYGVYMDGAFGCTVEENIFTDNGIIVNGSITGAQNMGVYIANADFAGGGVKHYRNDFTNLDVSTQVAGQNSTLQVDCNRFFHPNAASFTDFSVPFGVLATQGDCGINIPGQFDPTLPQANEFSGSCNGTSRKQVQSNTPSIWEYKSYPATQVGISVPCFVGSETYVNCNPPLNFNRFLACPQSSGTIIGISGLITTNTQRKNQINNLIDGGNTAGVLNTIAAASNGNALKNQLATYAPYLSEEAIFAVIDKNIAPGQKKQILEVNAPFTSAVLTKIQNSSLPNGQKNQLLATTGESALATISNTIAAYEREQVLNNNDLVRVYLEENQVTEAYNHLKNIGNVQALCAMIPVSLTKDTVRTKGLIDSLETIALNLAVSAPLEAERMTDFCSLYRILLTFESRIGGFYSMTEAEKNSLQALALKEPMFAPVIYGRLSFLAENYPYLDAYDLDGTKSGQLLTSQAEIHSTSFAQQTLSYDFSLYPNPTTELLNFDFGLGYEAQKAISIVDLSGELILKTSTNEDVFEINTSPFENGLYIVQVQFKDEPISTLTKRLRVQH